MQMIRKKKEEFLELRRNKKKAELIEDAKEIERIRLESLQLRKDVEIKQELTMQKNALRDLKKEEFKANHPYVMNFMNGFRQRMQENKKKSMFNE